MYEFRSVLLCLCKLVEVTDKEETQAWNEKCQFSILNCKSIVFYSTSAFVSCHVWLLAYFNVCFLVYAGSGSEQSVLIWTDPEHRESKKTTLSAGVEISGLEGHWGWTTVWRLVATVWRLAWWFFCWRGSWTAWRSALGGDGVDGHHYWWPCELFQRIWVIFLQKKEKNLGEQKFARLSVSNFRSSLILMFSIKAQTKKDEKVSKHLSFGWQCFPTSFLLFWHR